jgi:dihydrofolate reductase
MSKIIATEFLSLDGVMEAPGPDHDFAKAGWTMAYGNAEVFALKEEELLEARALLLGRVTYDGFAAAWPERTGEFADRMNSLPKYVVSRSPRRLAWNNARQIDGDLLEAVRALRARPGADVLVAGSASIVQQLVRAALLDELRLLVYPVALGEGKRLLDDGVAGAFALAEVRRLGEVALLRHVRKV